jgi:tetrahydromethanopterin S-methyltransferase subunit B
MTDAHKDYSGTPLWKKLGIREGSRVHVGGEVPVGFFLGASAPPMEQLKRPGRDMDVVLLFSTSIADIERRFPALARSMDPAGRLWIAWPKRAAKMPTDAAFTNVQAVGLDAGLVDNKTASITDVFQGIQFVMRLKDRPKRPAR